MYVTAHLVRSSTRAEGINSFLHRHGANFVWPDDAAVLADDQPGKLVKSNVGLAPGFNNVRAYLDVLAPDGTARSEIEAALAALAHDLDERRNPTIFVHGRVTIRFGVELSLELIRAQHLAMLATSALALIGESG